MQGKNILTAVVLAVLLMICGLAGAKAWAEVTQPGVPAQQGGPTWVTSTPSQAAATSATSSQAAATGSSEGNEGSDSATTSGQQAAEPEDGGSDSGSGG